MVRRAEKPLELALALLASAGCSALVLVLVLTLAGCTFIERVNVLTNAVGCDVTRGDTKQAGGEADVNVLSQAGAGGAQFVGALTSEIVCSDGTSSSASVEGGDKP